MSAEVTDQPSLPAVVRIELRVSEGNITTATMTLTHPRGVAFPVYRVEAGGEVTTMTVKEAIAWERSVGHQSCYQDNTT